MKGEDIDDYIATFKSLIVKAGWERVAQGSLEMFKQGLTPGLHYRILNRNPVPRTIDDWYAAAREEMTRQQMIRASLGPRKKEYMNKKTHREPNGKFGFKKKDPNAMEIDAAIIGEGSDSPNWRERRGGLTEQERKKRQSEGRCFLCGRQGHMRRNCQKRNNGKGKETKARKTDIEETEGRTPDDGDTSSEPPSYTSEKSMGQIKTLDDKECEKLLARIMDEPGF